MLKAEAMETHQVYQALIVHDPTRDRNMANICYQERDNVVSHDGRLVGRVEDCNAHHAKKQIYVPKLESDHARVCTYTLQRRLRELFRHKPLGRHERGNCPSKSVVVRSATSRGLKGERKGKERGWEC